MKITKLLAVTISSVMLLAGCSKSAEPNTTQSLKPISVSMSVANVNSEPENELEHVAVYCFAQKPGASEYTFEKKITNLTPVNDEEKSVVTWNLDGSLQRQFYFIANEDSKVIVSGLTTETTTAQFEKDIYITDAQKPELPFALVAKSGPLTSANQVTISAEFTHVFACLDVVNKYTGFTVDSIVLENAASGAYLYNTQGLSGALAPKVDINFLTTQQIYMYPAQDANLAIYGKFKSVRVAFNIALPDIQRATKYKVTFKSLDDQTVGFENNLSWDITKWNTGGNVSSTPDWK